MIAPFAESVVEAATLDWFKALGYQVASGPDLAPDGAAPERDDYSQVVLAGRLRAALARLNPAAPPDALDEAFRTITRPASADLIANNRAFHSLLANGLELDRTRPDGTPRRRPPAGGRLRWPRRQ